MKILVVGLGDSAAELVASVAAERGDVARRSSGLRGSGAKRVGDRAGAVLVWAPAGYALDALADGNRPAVAAGFGWRVLLVETTGLQAGVRAVAAGAVDDLLVWPFGRPEIAGRLAVAQRQIGVDGVAARLERLRSIRAIERAVNTAVSPGEAAAAGLDGLRSATGFRRGEVHFLDFERQRASLVAEVSSDGTDPGDREVDLDDLEIGFELLQGTADVVRDLGDRRPRPGVEERLLVAGCGAYGRFPLVARDALVGTLLLAFATGSELTDDSVEVASEVAGSLAIALHDTRLLQEVERLAETDPLTGLATRRRLFDLGDRELKRARRYERPLSALMIDLDHFKEVNDRWGHGSGDMVLAEVAQRCLRSLRDVDLLGRYGGEEFAALLPETALEGAADAAERIRSSIASRPVDADGEEIGLSVSIGVAAAVSGDGDLETLLARADRALYRAKNEGRDRVVAIAPTAD